MHATNTGGGYTRKQKHPLVQNLYRTRRSRRPKSSAKAAKARIYSTCYVKRRRWQPESYVEADGVRANGQGVGRRANNRRGASHRAQRTGAARNGAAMVVRRRQISCVHRYRRPSIRPSHRPLPSPRYTAVAALRQMTHTSLSSLRRHNPPRLCQGTQRLNSPLVRTADVLR